MIQLAEETWERADDIGEDSGDGESPEFCKDVPPEECDFVRVPYSLGDRTVAAPRLSWIIGSA